MAKLFNYLFTARKEEQDEIENRVKSLYFGALSNAIETFSHQRGKRANSAERREYLEATQRVAAITDTLEVLGVDVAALVADFTAWKLGRK